MKTVEEHLAEVLRGVEPLHPLDLQLLDAHGCLLAEDVVSPVSLPPFDNSAMDGYAVRSEDVSGATEDAPVRLPVVGDVAAGVPGDYTVKPGLCVRIMTGAPMPPGADTVIPVEWTDGGVSSVRIDRAAAPGDFIRRSGEDVVAGDAVLATGTHLGATQIGLLAAVGRDRVLVRPRPRVVVLSTGSELVQPGQALERGQIYDSNSFTLTMAAHEAGADAFRVGTVSDDPQVLLDTIEDQLVRADLVITSGGVSAGAYDVVKEVLRRVGGVEFGKVAMQPGMPQGFGHIGPDRTPIFTLPGNPVSAYVSFEVFVRPVLRRMQGVEPLERPIVRARLLEGFRSSPGKRSFARGLLGIEDGRYAVRPVGGSGSHLVANLAQANCLIVVPEETEHVAEGATVSVMVLERRAG